MEKGAIDLLMIVLEQELIECEKRRVVKSRKEYNHKYYLEKTKRKRIAQFGNWKKFNIRFIRR